MSTMSFSAIRAKSMQLMVYETALVGCTMCIHKVAVAGVSTLGLLQTITGRQGYPTEIIQA